MPMWMVLNSLRREGSAAIRSRALSIAVSMFKACLLEMVLIVCIRVGQGKMLAAFEAFGFHEG